MRRTIGMGTRSPLRLLGLFLVVARSAQAEPPRFYELEGFGRFLDGNPESTAITEEGAIALPPGSSERYADPSATFSAATARGDVVIAARVDDGQVIAIDRKGNQETLHRADESLVTALLDTRAGLFIAAGPPARIYRVNRKGRAELFHAPDAAHIWDMAEGQDGSIYCATGEPGRVIKVDRKGDGKVLFEPEQQHVRTVAYDAKLGLFVGGGERGVLYRSQNDQDFSALLDTEHREITSILVGAPYAYVAGVTGAAELASEEGNEQQSGKSSKNTVSVRSQLVRVAMDGTAEVMAGSNDEALFDMAFDAQGRVVVATGATGRDDPRGRLYTVDTEKRLISMIYQTPSRRITHLLPMPKRALAAVSAAGGRITDLTGGLAQKGEFFSLPFDTGINSRFGVVQTFGVVPEGTGATTSVRSGQTAKPDMSWSPWSEGNKTHDPAPSAVPNGRYLQVKVSLEGGSGKRSPEVHRVRVAYQRQNLPPFVREVVALRKGIALLPLPREEPKSKTISLNDKSTDELRSDKTKQRPKRQQRRARQIMERGALTVKWIAEDPNGDHLNYDLMVRPSGKSDGWQTLEQDLEDPFYTIRSSQLPDGHYQFRVRATDAPSNPDGLEKHDVRESRAVLIDNTPPTVDPLDVQVRGGRVTVRAVVADAVGPILIATYSLDGGNERPLSPDDGVLDGPGETFTIRLGKLPRGSHALTIRVEDEASNQGFGEAQFSVR